MTIRVGVAQIGAIPFDIEASVDKAIKWVEKAGTQGCQLVVFPEAFISAYPKGLGFGSLVGVRAPEGREMFRRYFDSAIPVPGVETDKLCEAAGQANLHMVIGVIERDLGTLYCTALFIGSNGSLLGKHRKLMPTASERLVWGFGDGSTIPVIDTPVGRLGAVICWENYMPMLRMAMYSKGVTVYCAPTADDRDSWLPSMRHIAMEGRCFVLTSCQVMRRRDFPDDYPCGMETSPDDVLMRGGAAIVGPLGQVLAGPVFDEETLLTADIDLADVTRAKLDFDAAGHYARPDVFHLVVNETARKAVKTIIDEESL
ncbi:MAG: carbon-nitrogen hydrolase family protein [Syntrophobacter sp.]